MEGKPKWLDVLLVVARAILVGVLALLGDAAAGGPVSAALSYVDPASLLGGALLVAPLALRRRSVSSSNTP